MEFHSLKSICHSTKSIFHSPNATSRRFLFGLAAPLAEHICAIRRAGLGRALHPHLLDRVCRSQLVAFVVRMARPYDRIADDVLSDEEAELRLLEADEAGDTPRAELPEQQSQSLGALGARTL